LKEQDPKNINRQGIIDFDAFMIQLFIKYKVIVSKAKEHVINAFAACDLGKNFNFKIFIIRWKWNV